jgi:ribose 5-phosphate isomerase A
MSTDKNEKAKKAAGEKAAGYVSDGMVIGLGTGSTAYWAIKKIGEMVKDGLKIRALATSKQSEQLAHEAAIPIISFEVIDRIDVTIDGADEADRDMNLVKGGGGALTREKIIGAATELYIIVMDESKLVDQLGKFPLAVEVLPFGWQMTQRKLSELGCNPVLRLSNGNPYETDNGNHIIDCAFGTIITPDSLQVEINSIAGVVENGLFVNMADMLIVASNSGELEIIN